MKIPAVRGLRTTAKEVFFMKRIKSQFVNSWHELKHLKTMVITSMFIAIGIVLGFFFTVQITDFLRMGFSFIANELTALMFGPVVGGLMAGITDILKYLLKPSGPYFFGFTFNAILGAVIYGIILYRNPVTFKRIFAAKVIVGVIVNLFFGTLWLSMLYGKAFTVLVPARLVKQICTVPVESVILYVVAKALSAAKVIKMVRKES